MQVHLARDGKQLGEHKATDLPKLVETGKASLDDFAWTEGESEWQKLSALAAKYGFPLGGSSESAPEQSPGGIASYDDSTIHVALGDALISNTGAVCGVVRNSRHDRVGDVSGGGEGSSCGSFSVHRGSGRGSYSSHMSFSISTRIDTRHEFWIDENGVEVQFVFPVSMPVADGQTVSVTPISLTGKEQSPTLLGLVIDNQSSRKKFFYSPQTNSLTNGVSVEEIADTIRPDVFAKAYVSDEEFMTRHPDVAQEWQVKSKEIVNKSELIWMNWVLLAFQYGTPVAGFFYSWGKGFLAMAAWVLGGLALGFSLSFLALIAMGKMTGADRRLAQNLAAKKALIGQRFIRTLVTSLGTLLPRRA